MITETSREKLIVLGDGLRASYLIEQAGYTLGIAAIDGQALLDLLPDDYLILIQEAYDNVRKALQDKGLIAVEAKTATSIQNAALHQAKVWRRKIVKRAQRADRMGKPVPAELLVISGARTLPTITRQLILMTKLFEENLSLMPGKGNQELLEEGQAILSDLQTADSSQEVKRFAELPKAVQDFYEQKGLLYVGLKVINDAGHELHADDSALASRYNLAILYRRASKSKPAEENAA